MSLVSQQFTELVDGTFLSNINTYSITHTQRFVGATLGFNRRLRIINRLQFFTGLHTQGSIAVVHKFEQKWDSTTIISETGQAAKRQTKTSQLFDLKGKNFFQWQGMIPLGLEVEMYQKLLFVRLEVDFGLVGSAFHPSDFASREMHGVGLWLLYKLP